MKNKLAVLLLSILSTFFIGNAMEQESMYVSMSSSSSINSFEQLPPRGSDYDSQTAIHFVAPETAWILSMEQAAKLPLNHGIKRGINRSASTPELTAAEQTKQKLLLLAPRIQDADERGDIKDLLRLSLEALLVNMKSATGQVSKELFKTRVWGVVGVVGAALLPLVYQIVRDYAAGVLCNDE